MFPWGICYVSITNSWICYVSLRFKAKENLQRYGDAFFYKNTKEAKELLPELCFDIFRNLNIYLNRRLMFPAQTRMNGRQMSSQTSAKQTNAREQRSCTNGCSKAQTVARHSNNQREFRQQRKEQCRVRRRQNSERKFQKLSVLLYLHRNTQNVVITCCFVKNGK